MKPTTHLLTILLLLALLAACVPVETTNPASEGAAADATSMPAESMAETRTITHAMGESEVPTDPQRVVVLDAMDNVLALGIQPLGAANWMGTVTGEQAAFPFYLDEADLEGIEWLGNRKVVRK